jgi:3-oxoacyl-[acyl-carrier-protein] synthase III
MRASSPARGTRILGIGEYRPARLVTNDDLAVHLDTSDEWIRTRTGIATRRIAGEGESVVDMATDASLKAIAAAGIDATDVGLVILATCTMPQPIPGGAARVASGIGAAGAGAYDLNAACAGFCYALAAASDAVRAGSARHVVVAAAERLSDYVDWTDRSSAILFGDGAGAVVVGPADTPGIGPLVAGSDGEAAALIDLTPANHLRLDGPAVFRWATSLGPVALAVCAAAEVGPEDLDAIVLHQANRRIITSVARAVGAPNAVVADDIVDAGNTSSASIPLALARLRREGSIEAGDLALTLAFGAGLTWAGCVVTVP